MKHNAIRRKLAPSVRFPDFEISKPSNERQFSAKAMRDMEPLVDEQIMRWLKKVKKHWIARPGLSHSFDIGRRIQYLTVDIITKICLGQELGDVEEDRDNHNFLAEVQKGNAVCQHFSVLLELNSLMYHLTRIPVIGRLLVAKPTDRSGVGKIMGVSIMISSFYGKN